jgi:hypothetical protein
MTDTRITTRKIKSRIAMAKTAFNKKTLSTGTLDINLRNKLVKCYVWSTAKTRTLRKIDKKHLRSF